MKDMGDGRFVVGAEDWNAIEDVPPEAKHFVDVMLELQFWSTHQKA